MNTQCWCCKHDISLSRHRHFLEDQPDLLNQTPCLLNSLSLDVKVCLFIVTIIIIRDIQTGTVSQERAPRLFVSCDLLSPLSLTQTSVGLCPIRSLYLVSSELSCILHVS